MAKITFYCDDCTKPFEADQGSRRHYCTKCYLKRMQAGTRMPKKVKKGERDEN